MTAAVEPECKVAETPEEREEIYRFRYRVYVEELGKRVSRADHQKKILTDELDERSRLYYLSHENRVVAALRVSFLADLDPPPFFRKIYELDRFREFPQSAFSMSSRLMVEEKWRGTNILQLLFARGFIESRERKVQFDFCQCRPSLLQLYERLGYRRYTGNFIDQDAGYQVPLVFLLEDVAHMERLNSPFLFLASGFTNTNEASQWFEKEFPLYKGLVRERTMSVDEFWSYLADRMGPGARQDIDIFAGLKEEDIKRFLKVGTILRCKKGDRLIRSGDVGFEMYILLAGAAEVRGIIDGQEHAVALFGPGQSLGEMAFLSKMPRTANVVALSDLEVLVLSQSFFRKAMQKMPEITIKVLFNLSLILCERLRAVTLNWLDSVKQKKEGMRHDSRV